MAKLERLGVRCIGGALDGKTFNVPIAQLEVGTKIDLTTYRKPKYDQDSGHVYDDNIVDLFATYEVQMLTLNNVGYFLLVAPRIDTGEVLRDFVGMYQPCPF